jgi:serine protease Do
MTTAAHVPGSDAPSASPPWGLVLTLTLALALGCDAADGRDLEGGRASASDVDVAAAPADRSAGVPLAASGAGPPVQASADVDASRRTAIVLAADRVAPAVVTVNTLRTQRVRPTSMWESFFLPPGAARRVPGLGSGFVIDGDQGIVVTNHHVVADADSVLVTFPDGRDVSAELVGTDPVTDVAVLRLREAGPFPQAPLGTSEGLLIGEWVVAIGNPFGYLLSNSEPTVTTGVVSALGRHIVPTGQDQGFYLGMIQTDASINPGNSGGPLVNVLGEVVGVNASIFSRSGGSEGLGFAIPIDRALRVARDLLRDGEIRHAWLGMDVEAVEADAWGRTRGVLVSRVIGGSPAHEAGLRPGRRILTANGRRLAAPLDWEDLLIDLRPGDPVSVTLMESDDEVRLRAAEAPSLRAERVRALRDLELITLTPQIRAERGVASEEGALIVSLGDALAQQLGFREGDVIVQINDVRIRRAEDAARVFESLQPGRVRIVLERGGGYAIRDFLWRG